MVIKSKYLTVARVLIGLIVSFGFLSYLNNYVNLKSMKEGFDNKVAAISTSNIAGTRQESVPGDPIYFSVDTTSNSRRARFDTDSQRIGSRQLRENRGTIVKTAVRQTPRTPSYDDIRPYSSPVPYSN